MTSNDIAKLCFKLLAVYFVMQLFVQAQNIGKYFIYRRVREGERGTLLTMFTSQMS